jgi:hypothetical protein
MAHPRFPKGDANGRSVPRTAELIDCLERRTLLGAASFADGTEFDSISDIRPYGTYLAMRLTLSRLTQEQVERIVSGRQRISVPPRSAPRSNACGFVGYFSF